MIRYLRLLLHPTKSVALAVIGALASPLSAQTYLPPTPDYGTYFANLVDKNLPTAMTLTLSGGNWANERTASLAALQALQIYNSPDQAKLANSADTLTQATSLVQNLIAQIYADCQAGYKSNPLYINFEDTSYFSRAVFALSTTQPNALQDTFVYGTQSITYNDGFRAILKNYFAYQETFQPTVPTYGYGNVDVLNSAAMFVATKMYPADSDPDFIWASNFTKQYWQRFINVDGSDPYEISGNYSGVGLQALLDLSDIIGNTSLYSMTQNSGTTDYPALGSAFFNTVQGYANLVSPSGYMPAFGDDYFSRNFNGDGTWCYVFERVAALSGNSDILYEGRKMAAHCTNYSSTNFSTPEWTTASSTLPIGFTPSLVSGLVTDTSYDATPSPTVAGILAQHPEKIVLKASNEPGTPMAMIDLNMGDHSHPANRSQISYYETDEVPQFYNYGRYTQQDFQGNQVVLRPAGEAFPFVNGTCAEPIADGLTHTIQTPSENFLARDWSATETAASSKFHLTSYSFAGKNASGTFTSVNPRLLKRDGTTVPLTLPFDGDAYTYPSVLLDVNMAGQTVVTEPQLRWVSNPGAANAAFPSLVTAHHEFDAWQYSMWNPWAAIDTTVFDGKNRTRVETSGNDTFAFITYRAFGTFDTTLVRQVVLTQEGILVILDKLNVGASAAGMTAGSLWQIYSLSDTHGPDWYAEKGEYDFQNLEDPATTTKRGFVVKFRANDAATTFGVVSIPNGRLGNDDVTQPNNIGNFTQYAAFEKETLTAGSTVAFTTVVVPTVPEGQANFSSIANNITWGTPAVGYADVSIRADASNPLFTGYMRIWLSPGGSWTIARNY